MTISYRTAGVAVGVTQDTFNVAYPATTTAGDILIMVVVSKIGSTIVANEPSGWTTPANSYYYGGVGTDGTADQGTVSINVFTRQADGTEGGTSVSVTCTGNNVSYARIFEFQKSTAGSWSIACAVGEDSTASAGNTAYSVACLTNPGITAGDFLVACCGMNSDAHTFSSESVSVSGVTAYGTMAERQDAGDNSGADIAMLVFEVPVNTGTSSGNPTISATASGSTAYAPSGAAVLVRLREVAAQQLTQTISGAMSFSGGIQRMVGRPIVGALSFASSLASQKISADFYAMVSWVEFELPGILGNFVNLSGVLSFAGQTVKQTSRSLAGVLSSTGAVAKRTARTITGAVGFSSTLTNIKMIVRTLTGALSFSGVVVKQTGKTFTAGITFAGQTLKRAGKTLSGAVSFSSSIASIKTLLRTLSGVLSFSGVTNKRTNATKTGALSFSSTLSRQVNAVRTGVLSFSSTVAKQISRTLSGVLSFSGSGIGEKIAGLRLKTIEGVLSFSGAISKRTDKVTSGAVSFSSTLARSVRKTVAGALSFVGATAKRTSRTISGALSYAGSVSSSVLSGLKTKTIDGVLSFTGTVSRVATFRPVLSGILSFSGSLSRIASLKRTVAGVLSFVGVATKQTRAAKFGVLSFAGTIIKQEQKVFTASANFSGQISKKTLKIISGAFSPTGQLSKRVARTLSATLSFTSTMIGHVLQAGGMIEPLFRAMWKGMRKRF